MRFSVFFLAALALIACASAALELRCSSGTLQGVGGELSGIYSTKTSVQRPVSKKTICQRGKSRLPFLGAARVFEMGPCRTREAPEREGKSPRDVFS